MNDERRDILARAMRAKHYELGKTEMNTAQYFDAMAEEVLNILDEYYGAARYWMATEFERQRIARHLHDYADKLYEGHYADFSS